MADPTLPSKQIPLKPTQPQILGKKIPENPFRCDRLIKYKGQTLPCDSALRRDGESLRNILQDTPEAVAKLDLYQANRKKVRYAAYVGSTGLAITLANGLLAKLFVPSDPSRDRERRKTEDAIRYSGIGITVGSVIYGLSYLKSNEENLTDAIIQFNVAHPKQPIEILFKTEF